MVIAAHAGTGKTRFANLVYDAVDFIWRLVLVYDIMKPVKEKGGG